MKEKYTRRRFLTQGIRLALIATGGIIAVKHSKEATSLDAPPPNPETPNNPTPNALKTNPIPSTSIQFNEVFDVIVVGSGLAGSVAAITSVEKGDRVIILEKMNSLGGNSVLSDFNFACVGSDEQIASGISDTPEQMTADMRKFSENYGDPDLSLEAAKGSTRFYQLLKGLEIKFQTLKKAKGHSVPRVLWMPDGGKTVMNSLYGHIQTKYSDRCQIRKQVKVDNIVTDANGRVIGVQVREGYKMTTAPNDDTTNTSGTLKYYGAKKGVIFTNGGFAYDKTYLAGEAKIFAQISETTPTISPGATSGVLRMLTAAGAQPINTALYHLSFPIDAGDFSWGILVDSTGKRMINEGTNRNAIGRVSFKTKVKQQGKAAVILYDQVGYTNFNDKQKQEAVTKSGILKKFDTLEGLAQYFEINLDGLKKTIDTYNAAVDAGEDKEFKKDLKNLKGAALKQAPFYAMEVNPRLYYTTGGIRIDTKARVLRLLDSKPIEGLFAAGEATGGIHGGERLEGCSIPDCASFGFIAGENASAMTSVNL